MNILETAKKAIKLSKELDRTIYMYHWHGEYSVSIQYWNDWIFKVYPGGRRVLSIGGRELAKKEGVEKAFE